MLEFFGGLILGGLISWAITHRYYVRSGRDQKAIFDKLSSDLKELILSDKRDSLSVSELNDLIRERVIDKVSDEPLPYKVCPKCGSEKIFRSKDFIVESETGDDGMPFHTANSYKTIECEDCGWKDDEIINDYERIKE